jgi:tape measure domain-containing protein
MHSESEVIILGTISTSLKMFDMMTAPLVSVMNNIIKTVTVMDELANSANTEIHLDNSLNSVAESANSSVNEINKATSAIDNMTNSANKSIKIDNTLDKMAQSANNAAMELNKTTKSFDSMANAMNNKVKPGTSLKDIAQSANKAAAEMDKLAQQQNKVNNSQQKMNNSMHQGHNHATSLMDSIKGVAAGMLAANIVMSGVQSIGNGIEATDNYTNQNARLALINDGLQTQAELQQKIYQAAQRSRTAYGDTVASVAKLGLLAKDAFSSNDDAIAFAELMSKSFKISGASASEASNGMYQLTQAMASGKLQGDEFRSIMENAPMLAQAIANYTHKSMGDLREMSSEGKITSSVIRNSLLAAADDINSKFKSMPKTFASVWTSIKNGATVEFSGLMQNINGFLNSADGSALITGITNSISVMGAVLWGVLNVIMQVSSFMTSNWSWLSPIIWGLVAAFIAYNTVSFITNTIMGIQAIIKGTLAAATMLQSGATFAATVAQEGLNAALLACPITWIIIAVIALIAIFYAVVAAINHFAGTSISATGIIAGVFMESLAFIGNLFIGAFNLIIDLIGLLWNNFAAFGEFFANVFNDPIGSVVRLFSSMADVIFGILQSIASAVDTLFGSKLANSISGWRSGLKTMTTNLVGEAKIQIPKMDSNALHLDRFNYGDAYNSGYKWGQNVEDKFDLSKVLNKGAFNPNDLGNFDSLNFGGATANDHLKSIDDKIDVSNEHLEILRDLAEQESIQNFVSLSPSVQVTTGDIKEEADINKIISKIETYMENQLVSSAEGVYS